MTKLLPGKSVKRETAAFDRSDAIMVELHPKYLAVRIKGRREVYNVPYDAILDLGRKIAYGGWKR